MARNTDQPVKSDLFDKGFARIYGRRRKKLPARRVVYHVKGGEVVVKTVDPRQQG